MLPNSSIATSIVVMSSLEISTSKVTLRCDSYNKPLARVTLRYVHNVRYGAIGSAIQQTQRDTLPRDVHAAAKVELDVRSA
jgi:hypothetical protein